MINTQGLSPLQSTPPEKSCLADFATLAALYEDIASHMFFSPSAAQATKGDTGATGAQGETGAAGPQGETGPAGERGPSNYEAWIALGNSGTEEEFFATLKGDKGDPPTPVLASRIGVANGAAFGDVEGSVGTHFFMIEYDDGTDNKDAQTPPNAPGIGSIVDLGNGRSRIFFVNAPGDDNFKVVSTKFE
jgi:hypothetical protein